MFRSSAASTPGCLTAQRSAICEKRRPPPSQNCFDSQTSTFQPQTTSGLEDQRFPPTCAQLLSIRSTKTPTLSELDLTFLRVQVAWRSRITTSYPSPRHSALALNAGKPRLQLQCNQRWPVVEATGPRIASVQIGNNTLDSYLHELLPRYRSQRYRGSPPFHSQVRPSVSPLRTLPRAAGSARV